jgi:integrase
MNKWRSTKYPGIRFYYHKTRKHGIKFDQYFSIRYQRDGKRVEEGLGWASEGMTLEKAVQELGGLKEAARLGKADATRLKEKREVEKQRRETKAKDALTFGEFFEKTYYPIAKRSKKPMSHLTEWGHFKNRIQPAIGAIPLKDLRPLHLERLKKTLLEAEKIDKDAPTKTVKNPKSPRTIQYIFATIRGAWNMARKHRVIEGDSPTKAVKKPKVENKRVRFLTTEAVKKLGFNEGIEDRREKFTYHSLRHTAASFLIQSGVDLYTVKEILGHGSIALTERYSHLADSALKEAANKMPDLTAGDQAGKGKVVKIK